MENKVVLNDGLTFDELIEIEVKKSSAMNHGSHKVTKEDKKTLVIRRKIEDIKSKFNMCKEVWDE